jgi:hypothetical protein
MSMLREFLYEHTEIILWLTGISLGAFVISILLFPFIIIRLPEDFFVRPPPAPASLSPIRLTLKILKNCLGIFFVLVGLIMLFIPGQGVLTMLFGVSLTDFPGKRHLEHRIIRLPRVYRSLNWLRARAERPPYILPKNSPCD